MYGLILSSLILIFEFVPAELYSWPTIVLAGLLVLTARPKFFFTWQNPVVPLVAILLVGLLFSLTNPLASAGKDIWYVTKPIAIISLGLMLAFIFKSDRRWIKNISIVVVIASLANIYSSIFIAQIDENTGRPASFISAFAAPFIWKYYPSKSIIGKAYKAFILIIVVAMIYFSESRAALLTFGVAWLAVSGVLQQGSRALFVFGFVAFAIVVFFPLLPEYDFQGQRFLAKLQNSINEILFEAGESRLSMYRNWRGFEAYRAYSMWVDATWAQKIFGFGHGSEIYLGQIVMFRDDYVESLHSIHNSYFGILVKTGILGVLAFLIFMVRPFSSRTRAQTADVEIYSRLIRGGALTLLLTAALISGPLNKTSLDGLLLIWSIAYGVVLVRAHNSRKKRVSALGSRLTATASEKGVVART